MCLKDVDFAANQLVVRSCKGAKDRVTMLPTAVKARLLEQIEAVRRQHRVDLEAGAGWVAVPDALARKYPNAGRELGWQWVFPATRHYVDRLTANDAAITCTSPSSSVPSSAPCARPASSSTRAVTRSGIHSPRTCWRTATTSGPSRNCSGIAMSARR